MKKPVKLSLLLALLFIQSVIVKGQTPVFKAATVSKPAILWDAVPMNEKGENLKDGVEFYSKPFECNGQKVDFVKLVNKNTYPVKISYQTEQGGPVQFVRVPSQGEIEGSCGTTDPNLTKLVLRIKAANDKEFNKTKQFIISTVVVSELK